MALSTKSNGDFDSLAAAVSAAIGGPLTRVDNLPDTEPNSNRKVRCTSALSVDVYISYDELADPVALDRVMRLAHAQRGVNLPTGFDLRNVVDAVHYFLTDASGPDYSDAEWQTVIDLLRTIRPIVATVPNADLTPGAKPQVDFTVSDAGSGTTAEVENKTTGNVSQYVWLWGDGSYSLDEDPSPHAYNSAGTYDVTLIAVGPAGTDRLTKSVTVS